MSSRAVATTIIGLLALGATGCDMIMESAAEKATESAIEQIDGVEGFDVDAESGGVSLETEDGSFSTDPTDEVPAAIAEAIALPDAFAPRQAVETETADGQPAVVVTGAVSGALDALADEIEAALEDGDWDRVERVELAESMPAWSAEAAGRTLQVQLMTDEAGQEDGSLSVTLLQAP